MMARSIRTKMLLSHVALVTVASGVLGLAAYALMSHALMDQEMETLRLIAKNAGNHLRGVVHDREQMLDRIAQGEPVARYVEKCQEQALLKYFVRFREDFPFLAYVNVAGREEVKVVQGVANDARFDIQSGALFQLATAQPNTTVTLFPSPEQDPALACVDYAFCRKSFFDEMEGVVVGQVPIQDMAQHVQTFRFGESGFAMVLDRRGTILAHPSRDTILKTLTCAGPAAAEVLTKVQALQSGFGRVSILGVDSLVAFVPVQQRPWVAMAVTSRAEFTAALRSLRNVTIGITLGVVGISIFLASALAGAITRPVSELAAAIRRVGPNDLSGRVAVPSDDEMAGLCRSFNQMIEDLQRTTTSVDALNHEIRERQEAEARQADLIKQTEAINKELQQFAYVVSHDLKAPLRGIRTLADWLIADCSDKLDESNRENLDLLGQRVDRMNALIDGILEYSRVSHVKEKIVKVDLNRLVPEVIDMAAPPKHIRITVDPHLPVLACGQTRMAQVLQNLISNAIKYMDKPEGMIHVGCVEDGDFWRFSVADNGPGIEEQHIARIFQLFQTLAPRDQRESTGVGLTIALKIVEQYGGRIWVESEVARGSTFFFTLPKAARAVTEDLLSSMAKDPAGDAS